MRRYWLVFGAVALVLGSGCQATGMGAIPSLLDPTDKATFGFVYDGTTMTFSGSYHDRQGQTAFGVVDVAFKGTGVMRPCTAGEPVCARAPALGQKGGCLFGSPSYTSQNPNIPDTLPPAGQRVTLYSLEPVGCKVIRGVVRYRPDEAVGPGAEPDPTDPTAITVARYVIRLP